MSVLQAFEWPGNVRQLKNMAERLIVRGRTGRPVTPTDLPPEILAAWPSSRRAEGEPKPRPRSDVLFEKMVERGESFWTVVSEPLVNRDITRDDVRTLVAQGMELTGGDPAALLALFNLDPKDGRRFSSFLRRYQCQPEQAKRPTVARVANEASGVSGE